MNFGIWFVGPDDRLFSNGKIKTGSQKDNFTIKAPTGDGHKAANGLIGRFTKSFKTTGKISYIGI